MMQSDIQKKNDKGLMTSGPIIKKIIYFAIPLFWGSLFQQLYNTADSLIVGNFLGSDALAAVSSSGSLIFLLVGFFNGVFMGAGVVIARYYGSQNIEKLQKSVHTSLALAVISGIALTIIGVTATPFLLKLMGTPPEVMQGSVAYFRTYFFGSISFVLYNSMVGILQAVGNSSRPLIYLIISSIANVLLDLLFIGGFGWGVDSAAFATAIAQTLSAVLCLGHLVRTQNVYKVYLKKIRIEKEVCAEIIKNGLPSGVQNSIISFANVVVQSNINSFGKLAMAGCGAYSKIEGFAFIPVTCFSMSLTVFIGQNLGAREYERAEKGAKFGIICGAVMSQIVGVGIFILAPTLIGGFNNDPAVMIYGVAQARTVSMFYFLMAISHCSAGVLRGAGRAVVPMNIMLCVWCVLRVTYITIAVRVLPVIDVVFWAYPLTWSISAVLFLYYLLKSDWIHARY